MAKQVFNKVEVDKASNRERPHEHFLFPDEINIEFTKLEEDEKKWHSDKKDPSEDVYFGKTTNYGWFPTKAVMGITNGRYDPNHEFSIHNGASIGYHCGSMSILFYGSKLENAIQTLKTAGYNIITKE